eukprot:TRINITY_DN1104_c0_g1_i1.p1 TRINITY_DN1104_c0_g1~~TRINITY_DN1104_c0_g1_i1.p1  ORF type:complete len:368 (-),score=38.20 TRINITY_DN1104_c0_g1_i1:234-1337(-)
MATATSCLGMRAIFSIVLACCFFLWILPILSAPRGDVLGPPEILGEFEHHVREPALPVGENGGTLNAGRDADEGVPGRLAFQEMRLDAGHRVGAKEIVPPFTVDVKQLLRCGVEKGCTGDGTRKHFGDNRRAASNESMPFLVTGCGDSGTTSTAAYLNDQGIPAWHDWYYSGPPFNYISNAYDCLQEKLYLLKGRPHYMAAHCNNLGKFDPIDALRYFGRVVQLVRNPLKVIAGVREKWRPHCVWSQVYHIARWQGWWPDELDDPKGLSFAMRYWLMWNLQVEQCANGRMRFEDILRNPALLMEELGLPEVTAGPWSRHEGSSGTHDVLTFQDLVAENRTLAENVFRLARRYGYTEEELGYSLDMFA